MDQFFGESHIEYMHQLLFYNSESEPSTKFVEKLCGKLESFVSGVNRQFAFQEIEVCYLNHYKFLLPSKAGNERTTC